MSKNRSGTTDTLKQYWQATRVYPSYVAQAFLQPVANILLFVVLPLLISKILAQLITKREHIGSYFTMAIIATVIGLAFNIIGMRAIMSLQAMVMDTLFNKVFNKLMQRSVGFFNNQIGGKLVSDANDYVRGYMMLFNAGIINFFNFMMTVVIGLTVIFFNSVIIGGLLVLLIFGLVIWTRSDSKRRSGLRRSRQQIERKLIGHLSDNLVNAITVKMFARESTEYETGTQISSDLRDARLTDWRKTTTSESARIGVLFFAELALVGSLIALTAHNPAVLATGIFAFTYTVNLLSRFFTINTLVRQVDESLLQAQPMTQLMMEDPEIKDAPEASTLKIKVGEIDFNNIGFKYPDGNEAVFEDLKLNIKPGQKVGLVGHSGGGKSTLTRLLLRFDDVTAGHILIDDQDIASVTQTSLRDGISYVPQEPLLFHRSIRENIAYGDPDASLDNIKQASDKAYASDFIEQLPQGYETIVGERGVKLSGGQRQRIAIARAILKNAPILVLDEATSALDSESEKAIQSALWELMANKTALVVAHRLSTIQRLDRIIVLSDGKILEDGTHDELLAKGGTYATLWQHQSGGFIKE